MEKNTKLVIAAIVISVVILIAFLVLIFGSFVAENISTIDGQYAVDNEGTRAANTFLNLLKENRTADAYGMTTSEFRGNLTEADLRQFVENTQFYYYNSTRWTNFETIYIGGKTIMEIQGVSSSLAINSTIPTYVRMQKEAGIWRIEYMHIGELPESNDVNIRIPLFGY